MDLCNARVDYVQLVIYVYHIAVLLYLFIRYLVVSNLTVIKPDGLVGDNLVLGGALNVLTQLAASRAVWLARTHARLHRHTRALAQRNSANSGSANPESLTHFLVFKSHSSTTNK